MVRRNLAEYYLQSFKETGIGRGRGVMDPVYAWWVKLGTQDNKEVAVFFDVERHVICSGERV